jgi:hypothetical protein
LTQEEETVAYKGTIFSVLIASPVDVTNEREVIRDILSEWNTMNSKNSHVILQPLGWESNVYPVLGDRPQALINKQILEEADLVIGVFWTRIGTPTGDYLSGSVEEIEKHLSLGKPVMVYFSNQPVRMDSVDPDQYEKLKKFKGWCKERGIIETYNDIADFSSKLRKHISLMVSTNEYFKKNMDENIGSGLPEESEIPPSIDFGLSEDARMILLEATRDPSGMILRMHTLGGLKLQTNKKAFGSEKREARMEAQLEEVIDKLEELNLIKATNYKREVFRVTAKGYEFADRLGQ